MRQCPFQRKPRTLAWDKFLIRPLPFEVHLRREKVAEFRTCIISSRLRVVSTKECEPGKIIFAEEAHFELFGYVNKQNYCIWGTQNPHTLHIWLQPKRVTVCCEFWSRDIIGPLFFEVALTIDGDHYRPILNEFFGTMCHTAEATLDVSHRHYS